MSPSRRSAFYEHRSERLLPPEAFLRRMLAHGGLAALVLFGALGLGMVGYRTTEGLPWLDAFLNAAMILSGMGEIDALQTPAGKLFAGCYALFSGLVVLAVFGLLLAPVAHRLLHRFHFEDDGDRAG